MSTWTLKFNQELHDAGCSFNESFQFVKEGETLDHVETKESNIHSIPTVKLLLSKYWTGTNRV